MSEMSELSNPERFNESQAEYGDPQLVLGWKVCPRCNGNGTLGGYPGWYTEADFEELGEDFREDYMNHRRTCEDCGGRSTVRTVRRDLSPPEALEAWDEWERDRWETEQIYEMERRMGA